MSIDSFFRSPERMTPAPSSNPLSWFGVIFAMVVVVSAMALVGAQTRSILLQAGLGAVLVLAAVALVRLSLHAGISVRRQRMRLLMGLIEAGPTPIAVTDESGSPIAANARFRKLTNWAPGAVSRSLERLFDRDDRALTQFRVLVSRATAETAITDDITSHADEGITAWRVISYPLTQVPGCRVWLLINLSSVRRTLHDLESERARLLDFLDISSSGLFSVDGEGRFLMVNRTMADLLEIDATTLLTGTPRLHDFVADPTPDLEPWQALPGSGSASSQRGTLTLRTQGNRTIRVVLEHELVGQEGEVVSDAQAAVRTRSVVRPLSADRSLLPDPVPETEPLFQWMFQDAPVGIALVDSDMVLIEANGAFCRLVHRPLQQLQERPLGENIPGERQRASIEASLMRVLVEGGQAGPLEILPIGNEIPSIQLFARRLSADDGEIRGLILHAIDISQQKQLEAEVIQAQKLDAVGKLAAGVAHDFNNLLTTMRGNADLLLANMRPGQPAFSEIMQIRNAANRAATMVKHLLAFSRQQTLRPEVVDVTDQISEFSHILRRLIGDGIRLEIRHGRDLWPVRVDPVQFDQVLMNLVVNARDAMDNRGLLTISTDRVIQEQPVQGVGTTIPPGAYVRLSVVDTGTGIAPEMVDRIFEPFFTTKEANKGTGLGLSTVYGIVRQTGGYIRLESTIGEGTTFFIYLPRHDPITPSDRLHGQIETADVRKPLKDLTGRETLLLVEDEDGVRDIAERSLVARGYTVVAADCGEEALEALEKLAPQVPDLVITDVMMPEMDGPTLIRRIRQKHPDIRVIFMSGYAEGTIRDELGDTEHINFLSKPFELRELAEAVRSVLTT